jgi:hypothetical protein
MWDWTKSGYLVWSRNDGAGYMVKRHGALVYRIAAQMSDQHATQFRLVAEDGAPLSGPAVGWDYDARTGRHTLVGPPSIPDEIVEAINKCMPGYPRRGPDGYVVSSFIDLLLVTPWRLLGRLAHALIEVLR